MRRFRILSPILIIACVLGSSCDDLSAHDLWIRTSVARSADSGATSDGPVVSGPFAGEHAAIIEVHLLVGHATEAVPVPFRSESVVRFTATSADGTDVSVVGREGQSPAGSFSLPSDDNGRWIISYQSHPRALALPGPRFEAYLREEGLDNVVRARAESGRSNHPGLERFSRFAKSLIGSGHSQDGTIYESTPAPLLNDRELGLPLELVLESEPGGFTPRVDTPMTARLLLRGAPLEGALVRMEQTAGDSETKTLRSDSDGRVTFTSHMAGHWMIGAVHMEASPSGTGARWDSLWASLTFPVRPAAPTNDADAQSPTPPNQDSSTRSGDEPHDSVDYSDGARRSHS